MTEEDYIELVIFVEQYQKRAKIDRTKFSDEVFKESKMRLKQYQKKQK
jgi:deoxycytidylate deaminase